MSAVRGYTEVAADLREEASNDRCDTRHLVAEAADLLAGVASTLPDCPTCGGRGTSEPVFSGSTIGYVSIVCRDCDHGKVTVEQLAATWQAVWDAKFDRMATASRAMVYLRSVRPPSPKEGT